MDLNKYRFWIKMSVRDYEIDYQGIVNNANYLHFMEHTRHEFCREVGMSFSEMHDQGIDPVLSKAVIEYKHPLHMGETFISCLNLERKGPKFVFYQDLFKEDGTPVVEAQITIACLENGKLSRGDVLEKAFGL